MKKILNLFVAMFCATTAFAQVLDTSQMSMSGQSSNNEEARYVLGLVRNGRADLLNKYFDQAPWKIQAEVDSYSDSKRVASVALFCVAVDLGNIDVVKAFVDHGYGPADLCRVQKFTNSKVIISKADAFFQDKSSSSSSNSSHSLNAWFKGRKGYIAEAKDSSSQNVQKDVMAKYSQIWYGEKKAVSTFFANPLDFASDDMFDYLWEQGFRSNNLFTKQALAEAKRLGRMDIWQYIMDNKPQLLSDKPSYVSESDYQALLKAAQAGPNTLAYEVLEKKLLGKVNTSAQAKRVRENLSQALKDKMASLGGNLQPADTLGYSLMDKSIANKQSQLKKAEDAAAAKEAAAKQARQQRERAIQTDYYGFTEQEGKKELAKLAKQIPELKNWLDSTFDDKFFQNYKLGALAVRKTPSNIERANLGNYKYVNLGTGRYYVVYVTKIPTDSLLKEVKENYILLERGGKITNSQSIGTNDVEEFSGVQSYSYCYGKIVFDSSVLSDLRAKRPAADKEDIEAYKAKLDRELLEKIKARMASRMPALRQKVGPVLADYIQKKAKEELAEDPRNFWGVFVNFFPEATKAVIAGKRTYEQACKWYDVQVGIFTSYAVCEKDGKIIIEHRHSSGAVNFYVPTDINKFSFGLWDDFDPATKEELVSDSYSDIVDEYYDKLKALR